MANDAHGGAQRVSKRTHIPIYSTFTIPCVCREFVARLTHTLIGAICVETLALKAHSALLTLVHI